MSTSSVLIRDFAYPENDPRFIGIHEEPVNSMNNEDDDDDCDELTHFHPPDNQPLTGDDLHSLQYHKHLFSNSTPIYPSPAFPYKNNFKQKLQDILHTTAALDDGLKFGFYFSSAVFEFDKVTEWEMDIKVGQFLLVAHRLNDESHKQQQNQQQATLSKDDDDQNEKTESNNKPQAEPNKLGKEEKVQERWASIDELDNDDGIDEQLDLKLYLDPDPDIFASQVREFVEYQKVYGEGWVTVIAMRIMKATNGNESDKSVSLSVQMHDLGLVPLTYIAAD